jgi:branched-chain amino acid transport system ATP-binding protein
LTKTAISTTGLSVTFGKNRVLRDVSLEVASGEAVAVIGPNGAGKSTLFGAVAGEHIPSSGTVHCFDRNVTGWPPSRLAGLGMGRTFQVARVFPCSVEENLAIALLAPSGGKFRWWDRHRSVQADPGIAEVLGVTGLTSLRHAYAPSLPHGDRKLLELAMTLVQQPRVILLDEPTAGMSAPDARVTVEVLKNLRSSQERTAILITAHDMDVVFAVADRVVLLVDGATKITGTPKFVGDSAVVKELYLGKNWSG